MLSNLQVAPHLEHFLAPWCGALRLLNDGVEKEHAFQGLCCAMRHNPQVGCAFRSSCCTVRQEPPPPASRRNFEPVGVRTEDEPYVQKLNQAR